MDTIAPGTRTGSFVLVRAEGLRLLLPQGDVGTAEYLEGAPEPTGEKGLFYCTFYNGRRVVAALSTVLEPLDEFPSGRFVLTPLGGPEGELCFAWDEVRVLIDESVQWHPLPAALRTAHGADRGVC